MGRKERDDVSKEEIMAEILLDLLNDGRIGGRHKSCEIIVKNLENILLVWLKRLGTN
jgi:hypothetical protein